jgi:phosphohistidine phosphatase
MIIHIVRHAEAVERTPEIPEEHRFLTPRGRNRFRRIAARLKKSGIDPDVILTSPLIRAVQTAEILAQALKFKGELVVTALLAHGFLPEELNVFLAGFPKAKEIALVGHEPALGNLARTLLAADFTCTLEKGVTISFKSKHDGERVDFRQLVDAGAKLVTSRSKALKLLNNG